MNAPSVDERRARQLAAWDRLWQLLLEDEPPSAEPPAEAPTDDGKHEVSR